MEGYGDEALHPPKKLLFFSFFTSSLILNLKALFKARDANLYFHILSRHRFEKQGQIDISKVTTKWEVEKRNISKKNK